MAFVGSILNWLSGDVAGALSKAYADKHNAKTEQDRIAAEVTIARLDAANAARAQGGRMTAIVQSLWAAPFVIYNAKLIIWDKALGLGSTDPLSAELYETQTAIVMFYFGGAAVVGVVRAIK